MLIGVLVVLERGVALVVVDVVVCCGRRVGRRLGRWLVLLGAGFRVVVLSSSTSRLLGVVVVVVVFGVELVGAIVCGRVVVVDV